MSYFLYSKKYINKSLNKDISYETSKQDNFWSFFLYYLQYPLFLMLSIPCRIPLLDQVCEFVATNYPRGIVGFALRGIYWKTKLKKIGRDVFIDRGVSFFPNTKKIEIGNECHFDAFITVSSYEGRLTIGDRVCVGSNTFINCRPFIEIGSDVAIGNNCTILGAATKMMSNNIVIPACPLSLGHQDSLRGVIIEDFVSIAINCTVVPTAHLAHPPFTVIEGPLKMEFGSLLGSNSFLIDSVGPGEVWAGSPSRKISDFKDFIFDMYDKDNSCMQFYGDRFVDKVYRRFR